VLLTQECFEWSFLFPLTLPLLKDNLLKEKCPVFLECKKLLFLAIPHKKIYARTLLFHFTLAFKSTHATVLTLTHTQLVIREEGKERAMKSFQCNEWRSINKESS
jgi:hypothetical protein